MRRRTGHYCLSLSIAITAANPTGFAFIDQIQEYFGTAPTAPTRSLAPKRLRDVATTANVYAPAPQPMFLTGGNQTCDGGSSPTGTGWTTVTNWVGDANYAGSQSVTTNTEIATIPTTGSSPTLGINMNFTGNVFYLGAIQFTSSNRGYR